MIPIRIIANPAAVGFEWESDRIVAQLVWTRGMTGFRFAQRLAENRRWGPSIKVDNPDYQPSTYTEAREMARAFVDASEAQGAS